MSKSSEFIDQFDHYVLQTYTRNPVVFNRGKGSWLWDLEGKKYLDFFPGWGVSGLGHCHPRIVEAIQQQAGTLLHMPNNFYNDLQGKLAQRLIEKSFPGKVFFANSGAEANEGALKLARRLGDSKGRHEIITMLSSFHGRTFATVTATGQEKYHSGFGPMLPGFKYVPLNDIPALEAAINDKTAAIMLELVQGEGGVYPAQADFVEYIRRVCDREGIVMIVDEVQTGMGRTGNWFAFQSYGITPDVMTLAKALGGGMPIGATVVREELAGVLVPGTHASTFGGSPVVCAAALAVFEVMEKEGIIAQVRETGAYIKGIFKEWARKYPVIRHVRGLGIMLGIELDQPGAGVTKECLENGVIINCTSGNILRVMPALNVSKEETDIACGVLEAAISKLKENNHE